MWKWLHPYAKTERTYYLCQRLLPWFSLLGLVVILFATVWGLAFAPPDYQQSEAYRIIYVHVPSAVLSKSLYSLWQLLLLLVWCGKLKRLLWR
jgi:heme exporter protein C